MKKFALDVVGLAGFGVFLFGVHQVYAPAALMIGGLVTVLGVVAMSARAARPGP